MNKYLLYEDIKVETWRRYHYYVEAESLKEALEKVSNEKVDSYDSEEMPEVDYYMNPDDNLGNPTREIYDGDDRLLYNNVEGNVQN